MINIKIGEQKSYTYTIQLKETGLPINLVNSKILFQVKKDEYDTDNFLIEKNITETSEQFVDGKIIDAQNGKFTIFFKAEDSLNLEAGQEYFYTIWRIYGNTKEVISASGSKVEKFIVNPA